METGSRHQITLTEFTIMNTQSRGSLIPVTHWSEIHPWPPIGGLRHLVFHAETNGFNKVIRRIGRRVLIDEAAFFEWANNQGDKP